MRIGSALQQALANFWEVECEVVRIGRQADQGNAVELVRIRRQLVNQFAELGRAIEQDPFLQSDPDLMTQATRLFSAFRSQHALNQASWPAVMVRDNIAGYRETSQQVAERSRQFWQWVEPELGFKR